MRNKKLFNTSFGAIYQLSTFDQYNLIGDVASNINSIGINGQFTLNITGKTWLQVASEGVWNISNPYGSVSGMTSSLSYSNYEVKAVVGYDLLSYSFVDWSVYGGLFHKGISYNNTISYSNIASITAATTTNFTGAVLGNGLTFYTQNTVSNVYLEGYITSLYGTSNTSLSINGASDSAPTNFDGGLTGGFGAGASTEIKIIDGMWIKPSVKYQMLFSGSLKTNGSETVNNNVTNFQALTLGIALSWR